jgi:hypothetical protein
MSDHYQGKTYVIRHRDCDDPVIVYEHRRRSKIRQRKMEYELEF